MRTIAALALILITAAANAGLGDPWYLAYRVQGGTIIQYQGPYNDKFQCQGDRFSLPLGVEYLGCFQ